MFTAKNRRVKKKRININIRAIKKDLPGALIYMDSMVEYKFGELRQTLLS